MCIIVWRSCLGCFDIRVHTLGSQTHPPVINDYNTDIQIMPFLIMLGKVTFKLLMVLAYSDQKSDSDLRQFNRKFWCVWKKHQKLHRKFGSLPLMVTIDQHTLAASFLVLNGQTPMFPSHEIHWNYCNPLECLGMRIWPFLDPMFIHVPLVETLRAAVQVHTMTMAMEYEEAEAQLWFISWEHHWNMLGICWEYHL